MVNANHACTNEGRLNLEQVTTSSGTREMGKIQNSGRGKRPKENRRVMNICGKCGQSHNKLGIRIEAGILYRRVERLRHQLRIGGGAWAFESVLLSAHPEVRHISVTDRNTGEVWETDRQTFDRYSFPFSGSGRDQKALSLQHWRINHEPPHSEPDAEAFQPPLLPTITVNVFYERARKPRPRIEPKRRRWH